MPDTSENGAVWSVTVAGASNVTIVTSMPLFYLKVISRSLTSRYSQGTVDLRTAAKELGARYVMEGSLRQAAPGCAS